MSSQAIQRMVYGGLVTLALASASLAAEPFRAKTADKYPAKQKQGDLIVAVKAFVSEKEQRSAFGNVRPYKHGVAPLLLVVSNAGKSTYSLENLRVRLVTGDREGLEPISGEDLASFNPKGHQPTRRTIPGVPGLSRTRVKKGPLDREEITQNEFLAPIVTPKSTASGFLYFGSVLTSRLRRRRPTLRASTTSPTGASCSISRSRSATDADRRQAPNPARWRESQ